MGQQSWEIDDKNSMIVILYMIEKNIPDYIISLQRRSQVYRVIRFIDGFEKG